MVFEQLVDITLPFIVILLQQTLRARAPFLDHILNGTKKHAFIIAAIIVASPRF